MIISYFVWLLATRTAKLLPHLWHRPQDVIHIPAFILFGYYFSIMKIYALFTLHEVRQPLAADESAFSNRASARLAGAPAPVSAMLAPPRRLRTLGTRRRHQRQQDIPRSSRRRPATSRTSTRASRSHHRRSKASSTTNSPQWRCRRAMRGDKSREEWGGGKGGGVE